MVCWPCSELLPPLTVPVQGSLVTGLAQAMSTSCGSNPWAVYPQLRCSPHPDRCRLLWRAGWVSSSVPTVTPSDPEPSSRLLAFPYHPTPLRSLPPACPEEQEHADSSLTVTRALGWGLTTGYPTADGSGALQVSAAQQENKELRRQYEELQGKNLEMG